MHRRQRIALDPPVVLAPEDLRRQVVQHVGGEGARDPGLEVALGAVVEQRPRGRDAGRGVGHVVGEHLGGVGSTELGQAAECLGHDPVGEVDRIGGGGYVGSGEHRLVLRYVVLPRRSSVIAPTLLAGNGVLLFRPSPCDDVAMASIARVLRIEQRE